MLARESRFSPLVRNFTSIWIFVFELSFIRHFAFMCLLFSNHLLSWPTFCFYRSSALPDLHSASIECFIYWYDEDKSNTTWPARESLFHLYLYLNFRFLSNLLRDLLFYPIFCLELSFIVFAFTSWPFTFNWHFSTFFLSLHPRSHLLGRREQGQQERLGWDHPAWLPRC